MKLRYLHALRAVMETGSATEAASRMFRTQPQVSRLIASLEQELGFSLFSRQGRKLMPTHECIQFYEETKHILAGFDDVSRIAKDIRNRKDAWLKIVTQPYLGHGIIPNALARFRQERPNVTISLEIRSRADVGLWISGQQFDLGIASLPIDAPAVRTEAFARVRLAVALPIGHPLCDKDVIVADDVKSEPFISLKPFSQVRHLIDDHFSKLEIVPSISAETSSGLSACQLVAKGLGITLTDPIIAEEIQGVVLRRWEPALYLTYGFLYPTGYAPSASALEFSKIVAEMVRMSASQHAEIESPASRIDNLYST